MCQWPSMPPLILGYSDCPRILSALRIQLQHSFQSIYFVKNVTFQASFASKSQLWPISIVGNRFWLTEMKIFSKLENSWLLKISSINFRRNSRNFRPKFFRLFRKNFVDVRVFSIHQPWVLARIARIIQIFGSRAQCYKNFEREIWKSEFLSKF